MLQINLKEFNLRAIHSIAVWCVGVECMCVCMYVYVCMYVCVYVCVCMYVCMYVYVYVCMNVCVYVCVCMYVCKVGRQVTYTAFILICAIITSYTYITQYHTSYINVGLYISHSMPAAKVIWNRRACYAITPHSWQYIRKSSLLKLHANTAVCFWMIRPLTPNSAV